MWKAFLGLFRKKRIKALAEIDLEISEVKGSLRKLLGDPNFELPEPTKEGELMRETKLGRRSESWPFL